MVNNDNEHNDEIEEITDEDAAAAAEEPDLEDIESLEENKLSALREKAKRLDEEKRAVMEDLAAAKAEFLNARKRLEEDKLRAVDRQKIAGIEALLPLCDSFTMAMADTTAWEAADANWRKGIEGIHTQLMKILSEHDVQEVDPTGDAFDPALHEAMSTQAVDDAAQDGTIVTVLQKGYVRGDNIIRPARVITGEFSQKE